MRAWALKLHRWLGLIVGIPFFLIAVSGAIYTWEPELRVITMQQRVEPRDAPLATATALRDAARAAVEKGDLRTLLWRGRDRTVEALIYVPGTSFNVQLDPYDARVVHETTPIQPLDPALPAARDTLVLTFRAGGFQDASAILRE